MIPPDSGADLFRKLPQLLVSDFLPYVACGEPQRVDLSKNALNDLLRSRFGIS